MLNKELLLNSSYTTGKYPPKLPDDIYNKLPGSYLLVTASLPNGGVDGVVFPWLDRSPTYIEDVVNGELTLRPNGVMWLETDRYEDYPFGYNVWLSTIKYRSPSLEYTVYYEKVDPTGDMFIPQTIIPVYNCDSAYLLSNGGLSLEYTVIVSSITKVCHIHLE